jgi:Cof subfamily protein (haloacid dehalogenase superfamily)
MISAKSGLSVSKDLRMAAVDLDGTLLGPDLTISPANRTAIETLQAAGIEVVLASGRHHSSMSPFAAILPAVRWIVSAQGGEVSDVARTQMLSQTFLPRDKVTAAGVVQSEIGLTPLFYTPEGIFTEAPPSEPLAFYTGLSGLVPVRVERAEVELRSIYKVVWIGTEDVVNTLAEDPRVVSMTVQTVRTHLRLFELLPNHVSKATGLAVLAQHLELKAENTVVFGDADNDISMFEWAGLSFAMDHGWESAKARAHRIAPQGDPGSAFARAVEQLW